MSLLDRGGAAGETLRTRLRTVPPDDVATTIISYEEQTLGWLARIAQLRTADRHFALRAPGGACPMRRVVPSDIVALIDQFFPHARAYTEGQEERVRLESRHGYQFSAILEMIRQLPDELITLAGHDYAGYVTSTTAMDHAVSLWRVHQPSPSLRGIDGFGDADVVVLLRCALAKCPDEAPAPTTAALEFISDQQTRESLRLDLGSANMAFSNGEWKAATVLAGSVIEALLLWALRKKRDPTLRRAVHRLSQQPETKFVSDKLKKNLTVKEQLDDRELRWFITVAVKLGIISERTAKQANLARDFRNLIHPGKVRREERRCTRGTALSALAAVHHIVEEFECRHAAGKPI